MKKFLFSVVFFSILLVVGCQEDSIVNPTPNNPVDKSVQPAPTVTRGSVSSDGILSYPGFDKSIQPAPSVTRGSVSLDGILSYPGKVKTFFKINGTADFTNEIVPVDPIPPAPQFYVKVTLTVNATLDNSDKVMHNLWFISSTSENHLYTITDRIYKLEKVYRVQGRNDGLALVCRFLVTSNSVKLDSEWLAIEVNNSTNSSM